MPRTQTMGLISGRFASVYSMPDRSKIEVGMPMSTVFAPPTWLYGCVAGCPRRVSSSTVSSCTLMHPRSTSLYSRLCHTAQCARESELTGGPT